MNRQFSLYKIFRQLVAVAMITNFAAGALLAQTKPGAAAAKPPAKTTPAAKTGWSGVITYQKTLDENYSSDEKVFGRVDENERIKHNYVRKYSYQGRIVVNDYAGTGRASTSAQMSFRDSDYHKVVQNESTNCHSWEPSRMIVAESTDRKLTTGTGAGEAYSYSLSVYEDKFRLGFTFPEFQGRYTHSTSETYKNLCPDSTRAPSASSNDSDARIPGPGASIEEPIDPKNPDVIEGSKTWFDTVAGKKSFVYTVTWRLRRKPQPLMITDVRFYEPLYPSPNDWHEIDAKDRAVDGNQVKIVATIANLGATDKTATVNFKELKENTLLPDGAVTATIPANGQKDVEMFWDTSGYAWRQSGADVVPEMNRQIEATIPDDAMTKDLKIVPKPVLLVPGFWQGRDAIAKFPDFFKAVSDKWHVYYAPIDFRKISTDNADFLDQKVREIQKFENAWHVDLISVTNGGLVGRVYVNSKMPTLFDGRPAATHLVMVGVPNMGTPCAVGIYGLSFRLNTLNIDAVAELSPDSMKRFNLLVTNTNGTKFAALAADSRAETCQEEIGGDGFSPTKSVLWRIKRRFVSREDVTSMHLLGDVSHFRQIYKWLAVPPKGDHAPEPNTLAFNDLQPSPEDLRELNFGKTRNYGALFPTAPNPFAGEEDQKPNLATVVKIKGKSSTEIEIPVTAGTRFAVNLYGSADVSAMLSDEKGETLGKNLVDTPEAADIFRTIAVKREFQAGKWKLRLENRAAEETEMVVVAFVDYNSTVFSQK